jgi:hypothetical protein
MLQAHHDNWLRRYVIGYRPWIFPSFEEYMTGHSRKGARVADAENKIK